MLASYLLRATWTLSTSALRPDADPTEEVPLPFIAWPSDIDWNGHVNNGRYLTLMDAGRLDHAVRTGLLRAMLRARCNPVVADVSIRFRREVRPFVRCTLTTRLRGWDERRLHYVQQFEHKGVVCAEAMVAIALRRNGRTVPPAEALKSANYTSLASLNLESLERLPVEPHPKEH